MILDLFLGSAPFSTMVIVNIPMASDIPVAACALMALCSGLVVVFSKDAKDLLWQWVLR